MKAQTRTLLSKWIECNPKADLSAKALKLYETYKLSYAKAKEDREAFEAQLQADAIAGKVVTAEQELAISYNFGKVSIALAGKRVEARASGKVTGFAGLTA